MTFEIGSHSRRPFQTWSISLGVIPAQARFMAPRAKSELATAISQQVSKILCGRYTSPADVISTSTDLMNLGLAWYDSTRVAGGELIVSLINGIIHFSFYAEISDDDNDGDDPHPPGPSNCAWKRERASYEFVELVSSALMEQAQVARNENSFTRYRLSVAAISLLAAHRRLLPSNGNDRRFVNGDIIAPICEGWLDAFINHANPVDLYAYNESPMLLGESLRKLYCSSQSEIRFEFGVAKLPERKEAESNGAERIRKVQVVFEGNADEDDLDPAEYFGSIRASSNILTRLLPFVVCRARNRSGTLKSMRHLW